MTSTASSSRGSKQKKLKPADDAEKRALIRRATFDLIGLPPTPEEVDAFLADESADAFAKVVDRLLASPHYGERWGRHWLDVVRYADTAGDNSDFPIPQMYRYRDWVIDAFNRDLPYDQFVREQLAGDLLPGANDEETLRAHRRHRLPRERAPLRLARGRLSAAPHHRGHDRQPRPHLPRPDDQLRALPRSQVRSDHRDGLLRALRHLPQHALSVAGHRAGAAAARPRAAGRARETRRGRSREESARHGEEAVGEGSAAPQRRVEEHARAKKRKPSKRRSRTRRRR